MRVVFMGTPLFAARILESLINSNHEVIGVVTRPDAIRGRGNKVVASPVKECARVANIPVYEYASLRSDEAYEQLVALKPDVVCVAAYGALLPQRILDVPAQGCLNVHASLLPRWRGAAPIERAILAGDEKTGVGIMRMEEGLDTGAVCEVRSLHLDTQTSDDLVGALSEMGSEALLCVLDDLDQGKALSWQKQDDTRATYAPKIEKGELDLNPGLSADDLVRRVRAAGASHPCRCMIAGKSLAVLEATVIHRDDNHFEDLDAGEVRFVAKKLLLGCSDGVVEVRAVKPDGKKNMDASAFAAGIQGIKQQGTTWQGIHDTQH